MSGLSVNRDLCQFVKGIPPLSWRWIAADIVFGVWTWTQNFPVRPLVPDATLCSSIWVCIAMLSCWTWCGMTLSALVAGLSRPALVAGLSGPALVTSLSRISGLARRALLPCLPLVPLLPRLACLSRRSLRSRWCWVRVAPGNK